MAEEAKALVRGLVARHGIACDLRPGVIHAACRAGEVAAFHAEAEKLARDYGYGAIEPLDRAGIAARARHRGLSRRGARPGGGASASAELCARAGAGGGGGGGADLRGEPGRRRSAPRPEVRTAAGRCGRASCVVAGNGYLGGLVPEVAARVMPINNFIVATAPLGEARARALIRDDVAVADSRFVVNYFRLSRRPPAAVRRRRELRLALPGRHRRAGAAADARRSSRSSRDVRDRLSPGAGRWRSPSNRMPAFQRLGPNVFSAGGYSGHGVALATLAGKLMAEAVQGTAERFDVLAALPQPAFPGGAALRWPLLVLAMSWYALRDRL